MSAEKALAKIMLTELKTQAIDKGSSVLEIGRMEPVDTKSINIHGTIDLEALALCVLKLIKLDLPEDKKIDTEEIQTYRVTKTEFNSFLGYWYVFWSDGSKTRLGIYNEEHQRYVRIVRGGGLQFFETTYKFGEPV